MHDDHTPEPGDAPYHTREPHNRLTRIGAAGIEAIQAHPEALPGDMVIVCMDDDDSGALGIAGFEERGDGGERVVVNLLVHLRAMLALADLELAGILLSDGSVVALPDVNGGFTHVTGG